MPRRSNARSRSGARGDGARRAERPGPTNAEVARALQEMSLFLEMDEVPFKPRAYEKAAYAVAAMDVPLRDAYARDGMKALEGVPGVGKGIARRVAEILDEGRCEELERRRAKTPVDVIGLTAVEGLGPRHVKSLHEALGIRTLDQLEEAARGGRVRELPHFGEKSERKILRGVAFVRQAQGRVPLGEVLEAATSIAERLQRLKHVTRAEVAGSIRRRKETVGDADFLVASSRPDDVMSTFLALPEVAHVYAHGPTKTLVRLRSGLDADLRVIPEESWGAALAYFTGSKGHNLLVRRIAQEAGLKLNEYGLFRDDNRIAGRSEAEIYDALGLPWIPPELREDAGEVEAARAGRLPPLIEYGSLRGDLQVQTSWTDGSNSMEEMVRAARRLGLEYIAVTDHTRDLPMARGNDEARLLEQVEAIRKLDAATQGIRVLAGAEVNIRRDGSLDVADDALAQLDVVGAGVHTYFQLDREEMTRRIVRAMENPHVDILFHPTARSLGRRPASDIDIDAVLAAALRTGTVLEIDGHPGRLDLKDEHVRKAVEAGVPLVISSDAHSSGELRYANDYGIGVARRGWASAADVLNTRPVEALLAALKDTAGQRSASRRRRAGAVREGNRRSPG